MDALRLRILPVYSEYHPTSEVGGKRLLRHQVEMLDAYNEPDVDVIINTAMTGDGKSLAAYLAALRQRQRVIAMYPTNELARDQHKALNWYEQNLEISLPRHDTMYSDKITQLMRERDIKVRLEAVRTLLRKNSILLTNPDLIHLIMSYQYGWDYMRKELPVIVGAYFNYLLFDEFHVFAVPQIISVINMLGVLTVNYRDKPPADHKKFVFLSATPSRLLDGLVERGGLRSKKIEGHYRSSKQGDEYRRILQPCEIELHEISQETPTEVWVKGHLEEIHSFFQQHRESKAAILVSSPATARRLVRLLEEYFKPHTITVGENTGLTSSEERQDSFNKHILVGTSTVDIGIDFHINYLIFEAFNAGSFLQRFGRLGRHDEFTTYRAFGLVPRFVLERLSNTFAPESEVERPQFNTAIREAFPNEQEFASYSKLWGVVQAAHVLVELEKQHGKGNKDENQALNQALTEQYDSVYGQPEKPAMVAAKKKYWRLNKQFPTILKDLLSFRGQSLLECGVWDTTARKVHPDGQLLTYDLFFLLANTEFTVIEEEQFMQEVRRRKLEEKGFQGKQLYLKIRSFVPERLGLMLGLPHNMMDYAHTLHHVQVLNSFFVREPYQTSFDEVNRRLKKLQLTCILSDMKCQELKQQHKLGSVFPVYRLQDSLGSEYSIAFGQEALLLDSILAFRKPKGNTTFMA